MYCVEPDRARLGTSPIPGQNAGSIHVHDILSQSTMIVNRLHLCITVYWIMLHTFIFHYQHSSQSCFLSANSLCINTALTLQHANSYRSLVTEFTMAYRASILFFSTKSYQGGVCKSMLVRHTHYLFTYHHRRPPGIDLSGKRYVSHKLPILNTWLIKSEDLLKHLYYFIIFHFSY